MKEMRYELCSTAVEGRRGDAPPGMFFYRIQVSQNPKESYKAAQHLRTGASACPRVLLPRSGCAFHDMHNSPEF